MDRNKSQLKIGIMLNYINIFLGNLIPIFYTPIMLQLLGQSEYGLYKLSSSVTSYLSLISLGIGSAVTRYLILYQVEGKKEDEERILGLFMRIFRVIAIITLLVGVILTCNLQVWYGESLTIEELQKMRIIVGILVCNMALGFSVSPYISVVNAHEKFVFLQCMNILSTSVIPIVNLIVLWLGYASVGMAISSLVINVIIRFMYLVYVRYNLHIKARYKNLPFKLLKEILIFSFWVFIANVVAQLYNTTDTVMIGAVPALATTGVAVYNIGTTFNNIMGTMTTGISNILLPRTNRMVFEGAENSQLTELAIKIGRIQGEIILLVITGFIVFGQPFIYYYAGVGYEDSYWVAVLIMIPNMVPLIQSICLNIIIAQNRHRFRSIVYLIMAVLNVIGTWILMQSIGIIGAALMTGLVLLLGQGLVMNWYYWKRIYIDIPRFWLEIGKICIIPIVLCSCFIFISHYVNFYLIENLCCGIVLYALLYFIFCWKYSMNKYEREIIREVLRKFINLRRKHDT